jgi:hypothetical protein
LGLLDPRSNQLSYTSEFFMLERQKMTYSNFSHRPPLRYRIK